MITETMYKLLLSRNDLWRVKSFKRGELIFNEGDECEFVCIIKEGFIYMSSFVTKTEIRFNFLKKKDIFGNNLIFANDKKYKATIYANSKCELIMINKINFLELLGNADFLREYLEMIANSLLIDKHEIKLLRINNLEERLLFFLIEHGNKYTYNSISSLASLLNTTRENLSRKISYLLKNGKILKKGKTLYIAI